MSIVGLILLVVLVVFLVGGAPNWGLHNLGWYPSTGIGLLLLIVLILVLTGRL